MSNQSILAVLLVSLFIFGCASQTTPPVVSNETTQVNVSNQTQTTPVETQNVTANVSVLTVPKFKPIKLVYSMTMYQGNGPDAIPSQVSYILWLNSNTTCGGRRALTGLALMNFSEGQSGYYKVTAYLDNGELTQTGMDQASSLAFDDMTAKENDFVDISLMLSDIYAAAGQNLLTDSVWNSTSPTMIRNMENSRSTTNYSVSRTSTLMNGTLPCTIFALAAKGTDMTGTFNVCVASVNDSIPLPFVVSFSFNDMQNAPGWELKSFSFASPSVVSAPQCLEPVRCAYVPRPSINCANGTLEQIRDTKNCVTSYECMSYRDKAVQNIKNSENPTCAAPSDALINKAVSCLMNNQNIDGSRDNSGCLNDITCRS